MTSLDHYHCLHWLMLNEAQHGRRFDLNDVACRIDEKDGNAVFEAANADFGLILLFPGWYVGEVMTPLFQIGIGGDYEACFKWLPINAPDKRAIIARLPISRHRKVMLTLQQE